MYFLWFSFTLFFLLFALFYSSLFLFFILLFARVLLFSNDIKKEMCILMGGRSGSGNHNQNIMKKIANIHKKEKIWTNVKLYTPMP